MLWSNCSCDSSYPGVPVHWILCGWITGWIIKVTFGDTMIQGLGLLGFNIAKESLPLMCGTLGVIGSFFKNTTVNRKND